MQPAEQAKMAGRDRGRGALATLPLGEGVVIHAQGGSQLGAGETETGLGGLEGEVGQALGSQAVDH